MEKEISNLLMGCVVAIITGYLLLFWTVDFAVYKMPFNSARLDFVNLGIFAYRFSLGFLGSWLFIIISKHLTKFELFAWMAKLGKYTLVMYTVSVICKYLIKNRIGIVVDTPITLEIVSLIATLLLIVLSVGLTKLFEKNKYTSFLFLGKKNSYGKKKVNSFRE